MGGASQPMLSYLSQTTIVGDKSQEYVLVREIAQQWTGNQVTNNNWEDVWLNEGFTTFVERHVLAQI
jgi:aminopeptidase N